MGATQTTDLETRPPLVGRGGPPRAPRTGQLLVILGVGFGWAVTVGGTVAMGIFRTPGEVARHLPDVWLYLGVWVLGACYALAGATSVAELATLHPRSGGPFVLTRRALGAYPGFVVGWSDWLNWCGGNALSAFVIGEYTEKLFPQLEGQKQLIGLGIGKMRD